MRIVIDNRQRRFLVDRRMLRELLAVLAGCAQRGRHRATWREVGLVLTDDAGMAVFNQTVMRHDGATDVITQRYEALPGEPAGVVGEIIVNIERAWQAGSRRHGWSPDLELALYLAHGCDHLNGEDDTTPSGRRRMRRRELRWLGALRLKRPLLTPVPRPRGQAAPSGQVSPVPRAACERPS